MHKISVDIKNAKISDLKNMKKILSIEELGWPYSNYYFKRIIKEEQGILLIAKHKAKIIGVAYGEFNKKENWAELTGVGVLKKYRGKGIGTQLIKEFEKIVKNAGLAMLELYAHAENLAKHVRKLGYEKFGTYINCVKKLK